MSKQTKVRLGGDRIHSGQDPRLQPRVAANPSLGTLLELFSEKLSTTDRLWTCEPDFRSLLNDPETLARFVNFELEQIKASPFYGPNSASGSYFPIYECALFSLFILKYKKQEEPPDAIAAVPSDFLMGVLSDVPITLDLFEQRDLTDNDILDRSKILHSKGTVTLRKGDVFRIEAGRHVIDVSSDSETLVLILSSRATQNIVWEYDRRTLAPLQAVSNSLASSRLEFAINYSGLVGDAGSIAALLPLADHELHYIRWAVVRSVLRLDRDRGLALLHAAVNDKHPHVSNAAKATLRKIDEAALISA